LLVVEIAQAETGNMWNKVVPVNNELHELIVT
jgi:hypothetical protein